MSILSAFSNSKSALRRGAFGVAMAASMFAGSGAITSAAYAQDATVRPVAVDVENIPVGEISASVRDPRITLDTDCKTWSAPNVPYFADTYCLIQQGYALKEQGAALSQELNTIRMLRACADALADIKKTEPERLAPYVGNITRDNVCDVAARVLGPGLVTGQASQPAANSLQ